MKTTALFLALFILFSGCVGDNKTSESDTSVPAVTTPPQPVATSVAQQSDVVFYTTEEVAMHSKKDDCWVISNGMVYDVTAFVMLNDDNEEIVSSCGKAAEIGGLTKEFYIGEYAEDVVTASTSTTSSTSSTTTTTSTTVD